MKAKRYDMGGSVDGSNPSPMISVNPPDNLTPAQKPGFLSVTPQPTVGMKKGGSVKGVRGGGIESKGRTKGRFV